MQENLGESQVSPYRAFVPLSGTHCRHVTPLGMVVNVEVVWAETQVFFQGLLEALRHWAHVCTSSAQHHTGKNSPGKLVGHDLLQRRI